MKILTFFIFTVKTTSMNQIFVDLEIYDYLSGELLNWDGTEV